MHAILPCSRILWILRNPLPRALSEYLHQAVKSKRYPTFAFILQDEISAIRTCLKRNNKHDFEEGFENNLFKCLSQFKLKKYPLSTGFYAYFIHAWTEKFPLEQNLFLDYDTFRSDPRETLNKISSFLGIPAFHLLTPRWKYNKANTRDGPATLLRKKSANLSEKLKIDIVRTIQYQVQKVYELTRENFDWKLDKVS